MSPSPGLLQSLAWSRTHESELFERFLQILRIPSISNDPEHAREMRTCAEWLRSELVRIGLNRCETLESGGPPFVYGEWLNAGDERPVVLIYAHYDVMPVDPLTAWDSSPFAPTVRSGRLYARGAIDDKCGVSISIAVLESMLAAEGRLPVNVKVLFDGEEEQGSPHIAGFIAAHKDRLAADLLVVSDGGGTPGQPLAMASVRGTVDAEVIIRGPRTDLHSGLYGGVVHNPLHCVGEIIAALHDGDGRVRIPGFYEAVRPPTPAEQAVMATMEPTLVERALQETGRTVFWGEALGSYAMRATALPTCDVNGVWGGYQGPGTKTVIPATAGIKLSLRIVPNQDPNTVLQSLCELVGTFACPTLDVEVLPGAVNWPATLLHSGPVFAQLQAAYAAAWGVEPQLYRAGGSVPFMGYAQQLLTLPIIDLGFGVGGNAHAPNEYFELEYFRKGIDTALYFYYGIATLPRAVFHAQY
jgi:acetylornithine deacetylase/succinyl-diaminopimelate desuccinylase-like protein